VGKQDVRPITLFLTTPWVLLLEDATAKAANAKGTDDDAIASMIQAPEARPQVSPAWPKARNARCRGKCGVRIEEKQSAVGAAQSPVFFSALR